MALVPWTYNNPRVSGKSEEVTYSFSKKVIKLLQSFNNEITIEKNTAFKLWDGAFLLAKYLDDRNIFPNNFWVGKRCIELGAGCGLVGIVACTLGAEVILTDLPDATAHTRSCCSLNFGNDDELRGIIKVIDYSWGEKFETYNDFDFIFGSDIIYLPEVISKLIESFKILCQPHTEILISYKSRGLGENIFFDLLAKECFTCLKIDKTLHTNEFKNSDYDLFLINKKIK